MNRFHRRDRHPVLDNAKRDGMNRPINAVTIESRQYLRRTLKSKERNIEFLNLLYPVPPVLRAFFSLSNSFSMNQTGCLRPTEGR